MKLRLGDQLIKTFEQGEPSALQSAVALLRTVFEDHYVDPDHQSCLFFHGCTISGTRKAYDFTVVHREGRVHLSEFTFPWTGPACVSMPLLTYAAEVVEFASGVASGGLLRRPVPEWQRRHLQTQLNHLEQLLALGRRLLQGGLAEYPGCCEAFQAQHGHLKRPLELQVVEVREAGAPFQPARVAARVLFGPVRLNEVLPVRLNRGDVVRAIVDRFDVSGPELVLEGVGSGGIRAGDRLVGLQHFYV